MATLSELRNLVRTQTETTLAELPDSTVNWYLRQAFDRTVAMESNWPSYQETWELVVPAGGVSADLPTDCNPPGIVSLTDKERTDIRLRLISQEAAEDLFGRDPISTEPVRFSLWGGTLRFWPVPIFSAERRYELRGYRYASDWISEGDNAMVDADSRLHLPLVHYATALAYAQQEDDQLEEVYMKRWEIDFQAARDAIMESPTDTPFIYGGGIRSGLN